MSIAYGDGNSPTSSVSVGHTVHLSAKSKKGENKLKSNGELWFVIAKTDTILFKPGEPGPWAMLTPKKIETSQPTIIIPIWVHLLNDPDFIITNLKD